MFLHTAVEYIFCGLQNIENKTNAFQLAISKKRQQYFSLESLLYDK
jgi:hypothetical protein